MDAAGTPTLIDVTGKRIYNDDYFVKVGTSLGLLQLTTEQLQLIKNVSVEEYLALNLEFRDSKKKLRNKLAADEEVVLTFSQATVDGINELDKLLPSLDAATANMFRGFLAEEREELAVFRTALLKLGDMRRTVDVM
ncbi:MAG: hypothetical protein JWM59_4613 [Verrucomicrobiales bacterium]|nr:hypothetical protein [Verrucomicrobiales bacterium]